MASPISYAQGLIILLSASMFAVDGFANTTVVGGTENWRFGFNYTNWAIQNSPMYLNDALVFKFDPPNSTTFPHSVYLLRDFQSFLACNLTGAKMVADVTNGGGNGFKFVMKKWQPYYFACGEHDGLHCKIGLMKFAVFPLPRCHF
ncbi:Cupredoxin superfamily protein [Thalictrum thalictroides]|uniref:Cupredoxin superfamily protein n=1 Tax=Thalictrum thalictroides TaxID=46969 RepID=A0A7J6W3F6_THATH|nr:Cupredoxin superfamily protein [Thalictrum thalictroides]